MTSFTADLSSRQSGADLLVHLARSRASGVLSCGIPAQQLLLQEGRPEGGTDTSGAPVRDRLGTRLLVHQVAASTTGVAMFAAGPVTASIDPRLDALGEMALALLKQWPVGHVVALLEARSAAAVSPTASFAPIVDVIASLGGIALAPPSQGAPLSMLLTQSDERTQRSWAALLVLGGLHASGWGLRLLPVVGDLDPKVAQEVEGLLRRGVSLIRRGQAAAAEPVLRQAVQLDAGSALGWAFWGYALYSIQGPEQMPQARAYVERALKLQPRLAEAHEVLGRLLMACGEPEQAKLELQQSVALNPANNFAAEVLVALDKQDSEPTQKARSFLNKILRR
jgi:tetratricopeptide (TPR) repeat protein